MSFAQIIGNHGAKQLLFNMLKSGRFPHALLFKGPEGVGKKLFALNLAKRANCLDPRQEEPCDQCSSCRKIDAGLHPDVAVIEPDGNNIKIEQVREICRRAYLMPLEGRQMFFILDPAEKLRAEAANALLKTLEEPPASTRIILIAANSAALAPTLISRCVIIPFRALSLDELTELLISRRGLEREVARTVAALSGGSAALALALDWEQQRELREGALELLEALLGREDFYRLARLVQAAVSVKAKEQELALQWLDMLYTLLRDAAIIACAGPPEQPEPLRLLANPDAAQRIERLAREIPLQLILEAADRIRACRVSLERNVGQQLALEALLVGLRETLAPRLI